MKNDVYLKNNIKVEREFYSIYELKRKYDKKDKIILDSDFQRNLVWNKKQKSELIESVLMGLPLPVIYLSEDRKGKLIVVDGRQRLNTFFEYMDNKFRLSNLNILKNESLKMFKELDLNLQSKLEDFQLITQVIKPPTSDRVKFDIFDRVNRGGTVLNNQEMRNALYQGKATKLLKDLANEIEFKDVTFNSLNSNRMKDRYAILRFIAFYLWKNEKLKDEDGNKVEYKSDIDEFLGKTMEILNCYTDLEIVKLENLFKKTVRNIKYYIGENAFKYNIQKGRKSPINMILFETTFYIMASIDLKDVSDMGKFKDDYEKLTRSKEYLQTIGEHRDSVNSIVYRFNLVDKLVSKYTTYKSRIDNTK